MNNKTKMIAAILGGSTNLDFFKKEKKMTASKIIVTNSQLRDMASKIVDEVKRELLGTERSIRLMSVPFCPTVTFYENPVDSSIRVEVWVNKVKVAEQSYHHQATESYAEMDTRLEVNTHRGLVKYFYTVLLDSCNLRNIIVGAVNKGNDTIKLPNGQTLRSEYAIGRYERYVSLRQKDDYPVFSMHCCAIEEDVDRIFSHFVYHWTDPGLLAPGDHYIEIPAEAFDA